MSIVRVDNEYSIRAFLSTAVRVAILSAVVIIQCRTMNNQLVEVIVRIAQQPG